MHDFGILGHPRNSFSGIPETRPPSVIPKTPPPSYPKVFIGYPEKPMDSKVMDSR